MLISDACTPFELETGENHYRTLTVRMYISAQGLPSATVYRYRSVNRSSSTATSIPPPAAQSHGHLHA